MKPLLFDLCCKAGGAAQGYADAGWEVVGFDKEPQRRYPFRFIQADALEIDLSPAAAVHVSPPCQDFSALNNVHGRDYPRLIEPFRAKLAASGLPYIIENVEGAPLLDPVMLCGTMFGLGVIRHRLFESNMPLTAPPHTLPHTGQFYSPAGHGDPNRTRRAANPHLAGPGYTARCKAAMGISWMSRDELAEAIPPAYTEHIGRQLLHHAA